MNTERGFDELTRTLLIQQQLDTLKLTMEIEAKELANDRNDWEKQKMLMQKQTFSDSEPLCLNVGGKIFIVALETMTQKLPNTHPSF
jgi:hypothetical protein